MKRFFTDKRSIGIVLGALVLHVFVSFVVILPLNFDHERSGKASQRIARIRRIMRGQSPDEGTVNPFSLVSLLSQAARLLPLTSHRIRFIRKIRWQQNFLLTVGRSLTVVFCSEKESLISRAMLN